ncbi:MAG: ribbon-helix-helix domain-containing protein [Sphingomicrobium sp.]
MKSVAKRSVIIDGRQTSITLEDEFWSALQEIAREQGLTSRGLVAHIKSERGGPNLSREIRLYVLEHYRALGERTFEGQ